MSQQNQAAVIEWFVDRAEIKDFAIKRRYDIRSGHCENVDPKMDGAVFLRQVVTREVI